MRTILCPCRSTDQECFSSLKRMRPCEDESSSCMTLRLYEDGSSMCITAGLYVHRSFRRGGRSDGHITLTVRSPTRGVWRQAPVNLNLCLATAIKALFSCQGARSPRTAQSCPQWASQSTTAEGQMVAAGFGRERNCTRP